LSEILYTRALSDRQRGIARGIAGPSERASETELVDVCDVERRSRPHEDPAAPAKHVERKPMHGVASMAPAAPRGQEFAYCRGPGRAAPAGPHRAPWGSTALVPRAPEDAHARRALPPLAHGAGGAPRQAQPERTPSTVAEQADATVAVGL